MVKKIKTWLHRNAALPFHPPTLYYSLQNFTKGSQIYGIITISLGFRCKGIINNTMYLGSHHKTSTIDKIIYDSKTKKKHSKINSNVTPTQDSVLTIMTSVVPVIGSRQFLKTFISWVHQESLRIYSTLWWRRPRQCR